MSKKIFITRRIPDVGIRMLEARGYAVDIYPKNKIMSQKELIRSLRKADYDVVLCLLTDKIDSKVFDAAPSVKLYVNYASGYDNIDVAEAKKRGIAVANAPASLSSDSVAQHAFALMLTLATRIVEADEYMRKGKYKGWEPMSFIGTDIFGKTIGLVGAGRIGERLAHYGRAMGLKVIYTDVVRNDRLEKEYGVEYCASIEELLPRADFVSLHVPLLDSTRHLMNDERIGLMKPTSFLINTSRGPVVDEKALVRALRKGIIAGAGLDVFEFEPKLAPGLAKLQNVVLTPHIASASVEARNEMAKVAANNIADFLEGKIPKNILTA